MDNTAQNQGNNAQSSTAPVGTANKEIGVVPVGDFIKPSEKVVIDKEVAAAGIAEVEQSIKLEEEHEKMGVSLSAESAPVNPEPTGTVQLPSQSEAEEIIKKNSGGFDFSRHFSGIYIMNSIYGLAALIKKVHKRLIGQPV